MFGSLCLDSDVYVSAGYVCCWFRDSVFGRFCGQLLIGWFERVAILWVVCGWWILGCYGDLLNSVGYLQ